MIGGAVVVVMRLCIDWFFFVVVFEAVVVVVFVVGWGTIWVIPVSVVFRSGSWLCYKWIGIRTCSSRVQAVL